MADWQDEQQANRRFPHKSRTGRNARGRHSGTSGANAADFRPRNMLGRYTIRSPVLEKLAASKLDDSPGMWLEIHELVAADTAYLASFDFGVVAGVMLIAGSRKSLLAAVEQMNTQEEETDSTPDTTVTPAKSFLDHDDDDDDDVGVEGLNDAFVSAPSLDRPRHAFEKNTFRTPKWFAQWRGHVFKTEDLEEGSSKVRVSDTGLSNKAHLEFTSAVCQDLKATFSCPLLNVDNATWQGWKTTSKATPAARGWNDLTE